MLDMLRKWMDIRRQLAHRRRRQREKDRRWKTFFKNGGLVR